MKVVIAPDSYKESLNAKDVAYCIYQGFVEVFPNAQYILLPMADGGEGTVDSLVAATNGKFIKKEVTAPLGDKVNATYGLSGSGETAFIEMSSASGLSLVPKEKRNPLITTTFGTGELIIDALKKGVRNFIIGIGGSATNDGGAGMLQALGFSLLDKRGEEISFGGIGLGELVKIDCSNVDSRVFESKFTVACDVDNPLTGKRGASAVFAPQKGANLEMVEILDSNLKHFAKIIKNQLDIDVDKVSGAGAAGGMGAGLMAFLNAELKRGVEIVLDYLDFENIVKDCDLVITGEGKTDIQTLSGKVPMGVAKVSKKYGKPVIVISGALSNDAKLLYDYGVDAVFSILNQVSDLEEAIKNSRDNLIFTSRNIAASIKILN